MSTAGDREDELLEQLLYNHADATAGHPLVKKYNTDPAFHMVCRMAVQAQARLELLDTKRLAATKALVESLISGPLSVNGPMVGWKLEEIFDLPAVSGETP